jgi:hypothetical protein
MKRQDLIRHIESHGCRLLRAGWEAQCVFQSEQQSNLSNTEAQRSQRFPRAKDLPRHGDPGAVKGKQIVAPELRPAGFLFFELPPAATPLPPSFVAILLRSNP